MPLGMDVGIEEPSAKRRRVRKGTHSCQECRRRKVKCIFAAQDDATCIMCERRGTQCIEQCGTPRPNDADDEVERARRRANPGGRSLVEDMKRNRADLTLAGKAEVPLNSSPASGANSATTFETFWSEKGESDHSQRISDDSRLIEPQAHVQIREALVRALPCKADIIALSGRVSLISALCYLSNYKSLSSGSDKTAQQQIPVRSLLHPERHPTLLARQMLLFAGALQHLSPKEVVPGLTKHHHVIMNGLAESAIKLVNLDDGLLGSLEGLENLVFEIFYHIDCGNIRRAWITTRRAVTAAQMLGLHRPGHYRFTLIMADSDLEPEILWSTIVSMERMLSLLLGLPTSTGHMTLAFQTVTSDSALGHNVSAMVGSLTAKILERNQVESAQQALDMTDKIDRDIILAAEQMPSAFWRPIAFKEFDRDSLEALNETRRTFGHMCYYSLVVQLHLPHMLSPYDASRRLYSKFACVNASREILTREIELRTFNPISASCRLSDFLALIAGMALMLGHITSHHGKEGEHLLAHQRLGDRAIVERALDCIDSKSDLHEDVLAVRCAALLRDLLAIEREPTQQHNLRASQPQEVKSSGRSQRDILIMRVPYLGNIQISRDGVAALPTTRIAQAKSLSEGVTIGGIGSLLIDRTNPSSSSEDRGIADYLATPAASTSETYEPDQNYAAAPPTSTTSEGLPLRSDPMFPDAAANFDDWVFQGIDTAFMESLMRGSAIPLSSDPGDESWDISTFP